jgi:ketosteroid isomerase-like protein
MRYPLLAIVCLIFTTGCSMTKHPSTAILREQVVETERAFAKTMADRDHAAFISFLATQTIFLAEKPLHGSDEVAAYWKKYFEKPEAPFSWAPDVVEVLPSNDLALSTGPVYDPSGKLVSNFTSVWRLEKDGKWRIIFDKGNKECDTP